MKIDFDDHAHSGRFAVGPQRRLELPTEHGFDRRLIEPVPQPFQNPDVVSLSVWHNDERQHNRTLNSFVETFV
jgi:hypothetical protein